MEEIMQFTTKKLVTLALLSAMAYVIMVFGRIPFMPIPGTTLKYDPKDIVIVIGGFIYGPLPAMLMSVTVSFIEWFTVSETGFFGFIMNVISTCSFVCTAAFIYSRKRTLTGALIGLTAGVICSAGVMMLWNYLIIPLYTPRATREMVAKILLPSILPFNLIKSGLNAAIAMLIYKPLKTALFKASLLSVSDTGIQKGRFNIGALICTLFVIVTCVLLILAYRGDL